MVFEILLSVDWSVVCTLVPSFPTPGISDWSIRHEAILGLSRVNKTCRSLPMKDGLSEVAWAKMVERQAAERDTRVLQAFSLAQVRWCAYTCACFSANLCSCCLLLYSPPPLPPWCGMVTYAGVYRKMFCYVGHQ